MVIYVVIMLFWLNGVSTGKADATAHRTAITETVCSLMNWTSGEARYEFPPAKYASQS
jgi:hypothetical protein